jgi:hypothetical protein
MLAWVCANAVLVVVIGVPAMAWACPACPIGETARQQVLADGFAQNLLIALAPFLVIAATCAWAEGIGNRAPHPED